MKPSNSSSRDCAPGSSMQRAPEQVPRPAERLSTGSRAFSSTALAGSGRGGEAFSCELPAGAPSQLTFSLPVDTEHKALVLRLLHLRRPHMMAFHLSWTCLFVTFMTTLAPAALLPVLQDALDLSRADVSNAGIASVCGTIFARVAMGSLTDAVGPRYSAALALLGTAPLAFAMACMATAASFIVLRALVGLSLSMFVVDQMWMARMFNRRLVGRATALSAGWGNTGFGATLLLMPLLYDGFSRWLGPQMGWRAAFFVPGSLQLAAGVAVLLLADDAPEGRLPLLRKDWCRASRPCRSGGCCRLGWARWQVLLANPRLYLVAVAYAACFGVELTLANIVSLYLFNQFHLTLTTAGLLGGCMGLMNVVSRFLGGAASDLAARSRGMRGRMAVLLLLLLLEGAACLLVGITHDSLAATLATLFACSLFCQMACGAVFAIVPFLSHRCSGLAVGLVAAGGNVGSAVTQALFFGSISGLAAYDGFYWMGASIICLGLASCLLLYWPMWGGLCFGPRPDATEERFYLAEYSNVERAAGAHLAVLAFAHEAHQERDPLAASTSCCLLPRCVPGGSADGCCGRRRRPSGGVAMPATAAGSGGGGGGGDGGGRDGGSGGGTFRGVLRGSWQQKQQQQTQQQQLHQQQQQQHELGKSAALPHVPPPLLSVDAACSGAGSSGGRDSGSGRSGNYHAAWTGSNSSLAPQLGAATGPAAVQTDAAAAPAAAAAAMGG